jgi:hypothetical protein
MPESLTQLPRGRYPASRVTIWLLSILVVFTGVALSLGIPAL